MTVDALHRKLQQLIGGRFDYLGEVWILIEVLGDIDSVVLRRCKDCQPRHVQQNAYGVPNRRTANTLSLKISDLSGEGYSEDIMVLLEGSHGSAGST
ncbi:MAG: hypothetical protein KDI22_03385 [Gammaproteobacteria bacterium]|nr:hypothetical protein [Gammaproteobacteria bacterium]MCP5316956.1 hypothetical protein [Chromatiaceae bacterium]MCW5584662.1 hypothetical protein [Chromatiales bacterium]MCB1817477.1 hypothetical protein [Gammaproteobacteria bacterium]MCP5428783.1 hypothetical protein [Chromatiaceae bacterium]